MSRATEADRRIVATLHRLLVEELRRREHPPERPLKVSEIYKDIVPYRRVRSKLGVELNADYEHALLRLLSGEGERVRLEPEEARQELEREASTPYPFVGLFRKFAGSDAWVRFDVPAPEEVESPPEAEEAESPPGPEEAESPAGPEVAASPSGPEEPASESSGVPEASPAPDFSREPAVRAAEPDPSAPATTPPAPEPPPATPPPATRLSPEPPFDFEEASEPTSPAAPAAPKATSRGPEPPFDFEEGGGRPGRPSRPERPSMGSGPAPIRPLHSGATRSTSPVRLHQDDAGEPAAEPARAGECRFCHEALPRERQVRYCPFCGSDQRLLPCPRCDAPLEPDWRYCIRCGHEVAPA